MESIYLIASVFSEKKTDGLWKLVLVRPASNKQKIF